MYLPGQFLTLLLRGVRRSFSLSSSPGDPYLAITVKRKVNGEISRYLQDHVRVGDVLESLPPSGRFTFTPPATGPASDPATGPASAAARPAARPATGPAAAPAGRRTPTIGFISAGSGIVPILPLIRQALTTDAHIWLINQNHSQKDVIFKDALSSLPIERIDLFSPVRLNNALLENLVGQLGLGDVYCCAPEAIMRMAKFTLRRMGLHENQYHQEHFTIDKLPHPPLVDATPREIKFNNYIFRAAYPASILDAAIAQGIPIPYSCRGGRCSTCAVRCTKGKVVMSINEVLTDRDVREGWVLTCTGYAASDLELEL